MGYMAGFCHKVIQKSQKSFPLHYKSNPTLLLFVSAYSSGSSESAIKLSMK